MSYNVENRLAQAQTAAETEWYVYAPNGQRVSKQKMGLYEWYFHGVDGRLIGTYTRCSMVEMLFQEQTTNVYFGGRVLQAQGQSVMKQDRLGTVSGSATNYVPFGEDAKYNDGLGFTGYYRDGSTTGLDYAQQRYYAPAIGRFTTADPYLPSAAIARPQSWNRYVYVENDPVNGRDPAGLALQRMFDPNVWPEYYGLPYDYWGYQGGSGGGTFWGSDTFEWFFNSWMPIGTVDPPVPPSVGGGIPLWDLLISEIMNANEKQQQSNAGYLYPSRIEEVDDCYEPRGSGSAAGGTPTMAYLRNVTYVLYDQYGARWDASHPAIVVKEAVMVTSGSNLTGDGIWSPDRNGEFVDHLSIGGYPWPQSGTVTANQVFFATRSAMIATPLTINFHGANYGTLSNRYNADLVTINGTTTDRPCQ